MDLNQYENTASLYDYGNDRPDDLEFYSSLIPASASVLEVGCGTGRVSLFLAQRGNRVVGIDLSQTMLDVFSLKLGRSTECAKRVSFHRMDMRAFDLGQSFDWILFPFRVFQALRSTEERLQCLKSVLKHMSAESRLILTLFNPRQDALKNWGKKGVLDFEWADENSGRRVRRYHDQLWHDPERQIIALNYRFEVFEKGSPPKTACDPLELGYLYPDQCLQLFSSAGLGVVEAFGHYDRRVLVPEEKMEQIYVLAKTGS